MTAYTAEVASFDETLERLAAVESIATHVPRNIVTDAVAALWRSFRSSGPTVDEVAVVILRARASLTPQSLYRIALDAWDDREIAVDVAPHSLRFTGDHLVLVLREGAGSRLVITDGNTVQERVLP